MTTDGITAIGIIHPGQMGVSIGAALATAGNQTCWASAGRSNATVARAQASGFTDCESLDALVGHCDYLFSICPPDQALGVAQQVKQTTFDGVYVDCNAISVSTAHAIEKVFAGGAVTCVDGGIIGPPAHQPNTTRLYLSGNRATEVSELFSSSIVGTAVVGEQIGAASALKMAYAGWTKGSAALLMTVFALAQREGVDGWLTEEWHQSQQGLPAQLDRSATMNAPKAWRFVGEMQEISKTLADLDLPHEFLDGAAAVYERLAEFKDQKDVDAAAVIKRLAGE